MKLFLISLFMLCACFTVKAQATDTYVYISPTGNDASAGTAEAPLATLQQALMQVRLLRQSSSAGELGTVHIVLQSGTYRLTSTIRLTTEDSGTADSPTIIESDGTGAVVLSGGIPLGSWEDAGAVTGLPATAQGHVWKTATPLDGDQHLDFRQLWVNGTKMRRASTFDDLSIPRLITVDNANGILTVPRIRQSFLHPERLEMSIIQDWVLTTMRVKAVTSSGERSRISFHGPESTIEFKRPWPKLRADEASYSNHKFYLSNAIELLNRPQEWFNDPETGTLYYWPRQGEDPSTLQAIAPVLETLLSIEGDGLQKVSYVSFRGITFEHSTWLRPSREGNVTLQSGQFIYDAYSDSSHPAGNVAWVGRPASAVSVKDARHVSFEQCTFQHTASTALDFVSGTKQMTVRGCIFNDTGGNAILAGFFGDETWEVHQAYNPADADVVCDTLTIDNNYIAHPATEDWGCLGVCVGFASNVTISHNEIYDTPYSAINMGWGWTKENNCMHDNKITANYIHHFCNQMRDGGAIYTLSAQSRSSIEGNRIESVGDPLLNPQMWDMRHAQFDIYLDEGTNFYTVRNNWCERGEFSRNQNGSSVSWGTNGSSVSSSYKRKAGLEADWLYLAASVPEPSYAPADSIGDDNSDQPRIDFVAQSDGFKQGGIIAADLNNDNRLDIVYAGGESFQVQHGGVRINMGNYSFAATQGIKRANMSNFAAGDIDGDGYIDLVQAGWDYYDNYNAVLMNDGTGRLVEQPLRTSKQTSPACGLADINNDGLVDYFFVGTGRDNTFYFQYPNRSFSSGATRLTLPGGFQNPNMLCADFDNDQDIDLCILSVTTSGVYTRIFFNDGMGRFTAEEVGFKEYGTRGSMAVGDVNGDGFPDMAIGGQFFGEQWNHTAADGAKIVTIYLNDGTGHFTASQQMSEYMFDNVTQSVRFCDWNNDGHTDVILTGWNMSQGNTSQTDIWMGDGTGHFTKSAIVLPGASESAIEVGDFSNSGLLDILISGNCNEGYQGFSTDRRIAVLCRNQSTSHNSAPTTPANLKAEQTTDGHIRLSWEAASDAETPDPSLTYNFYVRNLQTGLFVTSPNADTTTGLRRLSQHGNAWYNLSWTLRNLPDGEYAWSVQAVDASYAGGPFAPEQTFTVGEATGLQAVDASDALQMPYTKEVWYSLSGQRLDRPHPGINIVRTAEGTVRKVLMK